MQGDAPNTDADDDDDDDHYLIDDGDDGWWMTDAAKDWFSQYPQWQNLKI